MLSHLATDCSLLSTIFQDLRFEIKFIFSSRIEIVGGGEGLNESHVFCTQNSYTLFAFYCLHL